MCVCVCHSVNEHNLCAQTEVQLIIIHRMCYSHMNISLMHKHNVLSLHEHKKHLNDSAVSVLVMTPALTESY